MSILRSCLTCLPLALLATSGCYEQSSTQDSVAVETGLASDKPFASLDRTEFLQLCKATNDAIDQILPDDSYIRLGCSVYGARLARGKDGASRFDEAACERHRDECLSELLDQPSLEPSECDGLPDPSSPECDATVGDFERCTGEGLQHAAAIARKEWSCDWLAEHEMTELTPTRECAKFEADCPGFAAPIL